MCLAELHLGGEGSEESVAGEGLGEEGSDEQEEGVGEEGVEERVRGESGGGTVWRDVCRHALLF